MISNERTIPKQLFLCIALCIVMTFLIQNDQGYNVNINYLPNNEMGVIHGGISMDDSNSNGNSTDVEHNKPFWYHLTYKDDNNIETNIYMHRFYLDDRRLKFINARTFIVLDGKPKIAVKCMLHFEGAWLEVKSIVTDLTLGRYIVNKKAFYKYLVICPIQDEKYVKIRNTLRYVSLVFITQNYESDKIPVVIPEKRTDGVKDAISLCLATQYGSMKDNTSTPYLVQWVELLKILGVSKITWFNSTLSTDGIYYDKALQYYARTGIVNLIQVPIPYRYNKNDVFPKSHARTGEAHANEAIRSIVVNDCFYRDIHKYWYMIHSDKDEIIIPYKENQTYQSYIKSFIAGHPSKKRRTYVSNLPSLAVPSAMFYLTARNVSENVPHYLPLLKYTYIQPTEPRTKSPGYSKSFINPRSCNNVWHHRCAKAGDSGYVYLPENEILTHHYRYKCMDLITRDVRPKGQGCDTEESRQFQDDIIGKQYGDTLTKRTLQVLKEINYLE